MCDFQSNNLFQVAKQVGKNPVELGKVVVEKIDVSDGLFKVDFVPPAFINFSLTEKGFNLIANDINADKDLDLISILFDIFLRVP